MDLNENDIIPYLQSRTKDLESKKPVAELKDYYLLEEELLSKAKLSTRHDINFQIYRALNKSYFSKDTQPKLDSVKIIRRQFYFFFFSFTSNDNRQRLFLTNSNLKELRIYKQKRQEVIDTVWDNCIKHILTNFNKIDVVPNFLTFYEKELVINKVDINLQKFYDYPIDSIITYENPIYDFLYKAFEDFYNKKKNIFDNTVLNENDRMLCFGLLALCNYQYINLKDQHKKIFLNNMKKYISILGLQSKTKDLVQKIIQLTTDKQFDYENEKRKIIETVLAIKNNNNEKFLLIVFSFSCLLNSFVIEVNTPDIKEIIFTPKLKCSAKERQFLINILKEINAFDINYILESFVFQKLIKTYAKTLFDDSNKVKLLIKYQQIIDSISKVGSKDNKDTILNEIEAKVFGGLFIKFLKDKEGIFSKVEENFLSCLQISNLSHDTYLFNLPALYLNNQNPYRTSTHICICMDGNFTDKITYYRQIPIANLLFNSECTNADFYYFSWQNEKNFFKLTSEYKNDIIAKESSVNKAVAKFYGKFLAYIIASRSIFKFQSISLIGFSLGCHVIKHCLLELNKISGKIDTDDIIKDVIFLGGATIIDRDKYPYIFSNVAGNIVNVFSDNDTMLKSISTDAIGLKQLKMLDDNDNIVNYDLSKNPLITQEEYKSSITKILSELIKIY